MCLMFCFSFPPFICFASRPHLFSISLSFPLYSSLCFQLLCQFVCSCVSCVPVQVPCVRPAFYVPWPCCTPRFSFFSFFLFNYYYFLCLPLVLVFFAAYLDTDNQLSQSLRYENVLQYRHNCAITKQMFVEIKIKDDIEDGFGTAHEY